jgi:hypothetical protein
MAEAKKERVMQPKIKILVSNSTLQKFEELVAYRGKDENGNPTQIDFSLLLTDKVNAIHNELITKRGF